MSTLLPTWIVAIALGAALTAWGRVIARRIDLLDHPDQGRKRHREPIPLMGGVAVLASCLVVVAALHLVGLAGWIETEFTSVHGWLLISAVLFCGLGLYDDKYGIRPRTKFLLQIAAALPFALGGRAITEVGLLDQAVHLGWLGLPVTLFWLTLCVNSVNLLDGSDGVAGSVGVVVSGTVCVMALITGNLDTALIALALMGSLVGFLMFNWPPAKIFLGDSGSLTIGFLMGALAMEGSLKTATGLTLAAPLVLMSVPGFDTAMAVLRRLLSGRGIGQGDRAHLHHCLKDRGLSGAQTIMAIAGMCVVMGGAVIASAWMQSDLIALAACVALLVAMIAGRVFGYHETQLLWQHLRHLSISSARAPGVFRLNALRSQLLARGSESSLEAWSALAEFVEEHGGEQMELALHSGENSAPRLLMAWSTGAVAASSSECTWQMQMIARSAEGERLALRLAGSPRSPLAHHSVEHLCQLAEAFCSGVSSTRLLALQSRRAA